MISENTDLPNEYRPIPFWSWNDKMDDERLIGQIDEMADKGVGGFFIHARTGLETEYMSEEWFDRIKTCLLRAKQRGIAVWIYDEDGWPSGFAAGAVPALGDQYYARGLAIERLDCADAAAGIENLLGVYRIDPASHRIETLAENQWKAAGKGPVYAVSHTAGKYYIDVLNRDVVSKFIAFTHERYYQRFGDEFGKTLKGFFTDEPRLSEGDIPWSYILPREFQKKYGYDILPLLPALFVECSGYEKIRYDFWKLVSELFVTSYMKQIYDWCAAHKVMLTGHVMMEESLYSQMTGTAGSMPFYEFMSIPGMDWLRRDIGNSVISKQVGSVAFQLGKKHVLTESYALTGWNVSFEELKWIAEWQFQNGVNLMCQHLQGFTLRGFRKRDYPPSLFIQQPWWNEYRTFTDYLTRLGKTISDSGEIVNLLVLHPMGSAWIAYDGTKNKRIQSLDNDLTELTDALDGMHVGYHFGDETILRRHARVENGEISVGQYEYGVILMPSMLSVDENTYRLLDSFVNQGGKILSFGCYPHLIDGREDDRLSRLREHVLILDRDKAALRKALAENSLCPVNISENGKEIGRIRVRQMRHDGKRLYFLTNLDREKSFDAELSIDGVEGLQLLDLLSGKEKELHGMSEDGKATVKLRFMPMQSYLLKEGKKCTLPKKTDGKTETISAALRDEWNISKADLNSMTLDYCSYKVDGSDWKKPVPVIKLMDILLGLRRACDIELKFEFEVESEIGGGRPFYLVMERAAEYRIAINGRPVQSVRQGWWKDTEFDKLDISGQVKTGRNEILLKRRFYQSQKVYDVLFGRNVYETEKNKLTYDVELENIYLVGGFAVMSKTAFTERARRAVHTSGPFVIRQLPQKVRTGDLTAQGFAFFAGKVELTKKIRIDKNPGTRYLLELQKPDAVAERVFVNGTDAGLMAWAPYRLDLTDLLKNGENELTIRLYGSNRNLFGPHHRRGGEQYAVGPESFTGRWGWCDKKGEAFSATREERNANYWEEGYSFVKFGLRADGEKVSDER